MMSSEFLLEFSKSRCLNYNKITFIHLKNLSAFAVLLKYLHATRSQSCSAVFMSISFTVLVPTFKCMIDFRLTFVHGII